MARPALYLVPPPAPEPETVRDTRWHRPAWSLGPWGLLPALVPWDLRTAVTVAVGYLQCLVGSDGARLYLWACVPFLEALTLAPWWVVLVAGASIAVARYEV